MSAPASIAQEIKARDGAELDGAARDGTARDGTAREGNNRIGALAIGGGIGTLRQRLAVASESAATLQTAAS
jgi:hypothetical protein